MARKRTSSTKRLRDQSRRRRQEDKAKRKTDRKMAKLEPPEGADGESAPTEGDPGDETHEGEAPRAATADEPETEDDREPQEDPVLELDRSA